MIKWSVGTKALATAAQLLLAAFLFMLAAGILIFVYVVIRMTIDVLHDQREERKKKKKEGR